MIRRRVAGGAGALFVALFLLITVRLASGHDPALAKTAAATASAQTQVASNPYSYGDPNGYYGQAPGIDDSQQPSYDAQSQSGFAGQQPAGNSSSAITTRQS